MTILEEFRKRKALIDNVNHQEATARVAAFHTWLESQDATNDILAEIRQSANADELMKDTNHQHPPIASTPEEVAAVGLWLMHKCKEGTDLFNLAHNHGIRPPYNTNNIQERVDEVLSRFVEPTIEHIEAKLEDQSEEEDAGHPLGFDIRQPDYPLEITESLQQFLKDHPDYNCNAFLIMQFGKTKTHQQIVAAIKESLSRYGIEALRADDKEYHDDLFPNVLTYLYGCRFGIAVFERLENEDFNPNVSLELGYMTALHKSVCLLKDQTLKTLHTDLVGKLYKTFDPQDPEATIPPELEKWLRDKDIINI